MKNSDMKKVSDYLMSNKVDTSYGWRITASEKTLVYSDKNNVRHTISIKDILEVSK